MPTPDPDPQVQLLRKQVHDYLASHPEEAKALRVRFGIKAPGDEDDLLRELARAIAKLKKRKQ